jgi:transposase InsO family protein
MGEYTRTALLKTKKEILLAVEEGKLSVKDGASLLGLTRQGLWKLRKNFKAYHNLALVGRKRGPKSYYRVFNRTSEWIEEKIEEIYLKFGGGPDNLLWIIEDNYHDEQAMISLSRSTIYRILVRRKVLGFPKNRKERKKHNQKYTKGYPGEEIQVDTTELFGKGKGTLLDLVDDYSRWSRSYFYQGGDSLKTAKCLERFLMEVPFPVEAVRTDNGSEFKKHFSKFCEERGIRQIRNRIKTPEHNGKVERFHRTVEEECLWKVVREGKGKDANLVNYELTKHNQWYDTKRRHLGYRMQGKTPLQKIEQFIINQKSPDFLAGEVNETLILYRLHKFRNLLDCLKESNGSFL